MSTPLGSLQRLAPLAITTLFGACFDTTTLTDITGGGRLLSITVDAGVVEVADTVRLTASGNVSGVLGLLTYDPVLDAQWAVADPTVARLEPLPPPPPEDSFPMARTLVRGLRPGTTRVTATARGKTGEATVRVFPILGAIHLRPTRDTLAVGDTTHMTVSVVDTGGVPIEAVPLVFQVSGGVRLGADHSTGKDVIAIGPGAAAISARFRRVVGEAALVVIPRTP
jgi:hypothetical protein